jgi:membrane-associated protein
LARSASVHSETSRWLNRKHLLSTKNFYERHGGKTILFARFLPIFRTFVPFVAGIGQMPYGRFSLYNVLGGTLWVLSFLLAGYFFGNIPTVKKNFEIVIVSIIFISCLPMLVQVVRGYLSSKKAAVRT